MKKKLRLTVALFTIAAMVLTSASFAFAASDVPQTRAAVNETEDNGTMEKANSIAVGDTVYGTAKDIYEYDWYKFNISSAGRVDITFNHDLSNRADWRVTLYDSAQNSVREFTTDGTQTSVNSGRIGLPAGTYYVQVAHGFNINQEKYNFKLNYAASSVWEKEINNTPMQANEVQTGKTYYGASKYVQESDYFKFMIPANGRVDITFNHDAKKDRAWNVTLRDEDFNEICAIGNAAGESIKTGRIGLPAGTYYFQVFNYDLNGGNYNFNVNYYKSSVWETELNDTPQTADVIQTGKTYYGGSQYGDRDYYKFTLPAAGNVSLDFNRLYDADGYWEVSLYDSAMNQKTIMSTSGGDKANQKTKTLYLQKGTYYALVNAGGMTEGECYSLKANYLFSTKAPAVTAKLYGHDDVKASWTKVSGASGYEVSYKKSTSSSYSAPVRTTNLYYKKSGLSDGAKYYFKVVPYKTINGKRYYGVAKTSSVYTLKKLATPTVTKYSSSKVKVKWSNINGESGYQISKSTSKTGTSIVSTYGTTSGTYKTLSVKKGKTYYYKVRAYKTVDGKKIYGPWSSVRAYKLK